MSGEISWSSSTRGGAAKHPTRHLTVPAAKNYLAPNVSRVTAEKPSSRPCERYFKFGSEAAFLLPCLPVRWKWSWWWENGHCQRFHCLFKLYCEHLASLRVSGRHPWAWNHILELDRHSSGAQTAAGRGKHVLRSNIWHSFWQQP